MSDSTSIIKCFVSDCPNHSEMNVPGLQFFEFPRLNHEKRLAWIQSLKDQYQEHLEPLEESRICNGHFFDKTSETDDSEHPSYKPLFFPKMDKETRKSLKKAAKEKLGILIPPQIQVLNSDLPQFTHESIVADIDKDPGVPVVRNPKLTNKDCNRLVRKPKPSSTTSRKSTSVPRQRYCCVVGCYNNTDSPEVEFLTFPIRGSDQCKAWIRRINRVNSDGSPWNPSSDSVICSVHFFGGEPKSSNIYCPSYAPAFFPHNIERWERIASRLKLRSEMGSPSYVGKESDDEDEGTCMEGEDPSTEKVKLVYPSWMAEISEYVLKCQQEKKFTDIVISNGRQSFEGHKIILMSALPMIKMALLNMDNHDTEEKPVVILPDMSAYEMELLQKVVYSKGSRSVSQYVFPRRVCTTESIVRQFSEKNGEEVVINDFGSDTKRIRLSDDKKQVLAPIPILTLDKNITSNDFFRLYNNVACKAAKNKALHNSLQPSHVETTITEELLIEPPHNVPVVTEDKATLDSIMKQVTTMRAVNPKKFTVRNANKKYTVIMQTVKRPDASTKPPPSLEEMKARRSERPTRPYCSACEKEFDTPTERDQHKMSHLSEPDQFPNSLTCKFCQKSFKTVEQKRIHETYHTKIGWKCDICEKGFPTAPKLLDHSFIHKTTSRFMCQFCSKGFRVKSKLILHENMHRNISKHKCKYCYRLFISARSLADHMNFHEGVRPYVCDKCGKSFCTSPSLSQHRSRVHNRNDSALGRHKCRHCSKRFRYKSVMTNHMEHCECRPQMTLLHI